MPPRNNTIATLIMSTCFVNILPVWTLIWRSTGAYIFGHSGNWYPCVVAGTRLRPQTDVVEQYYYIGFLDRRPLPAVSTPGPYPYPVKPILSLPPPPPLSLSIARVSIVDRTATGEHRLLPSGAPGLGALYYWSVIDFEKNKRLVLRVGVHPYFSEVMILTWGAV